MTVTGLTSAGEISSTQESAPLDFLPARMLNEFVYCPRLFYYEFVEGVFRHNADTLRGKALHKKVDSGKGDLPAVTPPDEDGDSPEKVDGPEETIHSRSVSLSSDRLRATAKMDLVEVRAGMDTSLVATVNVCPVDYKAGSPREGEEGPEIWDADKIQIGLQCLILRDNGYTCDEGIIYYRGTKQRVSLPITPQIETWILAQIEEARRTALGAIPKPLIDSPKCPRCSLVTICLPDETSLLHLAPDHPDDEVVVLPGQERFPFDLEFGPNSPVNSVNIDAPSAGGARLRPTRPLRRLMAARDDTRPLYIATHGVSIGRKSELIQVKEKSKPIAEVRISDLNHVSIFGSAIISTPLIQFLCEKDVPISYFSMGGWFYGLTRGHSLKNVFTRIAQFEAAAMPEASLRIARSFVHGKLKNQRTLLMRNHLSPPDLTLQRLRYAAQAALEAKADSELLGIEGAGALAYFESFSGMIKLSEDPDGLPTKGDDSGQQFFTFDFTGRNRRPPRDAVNALLSMAYSLLTRDCTIAAFTVGFDPYVGFYHRPRFGRPSLALDLMEEFRPLIADSVVITVINNRIITPSDFVRAGSAINLSPDGRKKFFQAYENRLNATIVHPVFDYQVSYRRALELQARLLAKTLTGEIEQYIPFTTR